MDLRDCLIIIKGNECTAKVLSIDYDSVKRVYDVRFHNNPRFVYHYRKADVAIHHPVRLPAEYYSVSSGKRRFTALRELYRYEKAGYWYLVEDGRRWLLADAETEVIHSALEDGFSRNVIAYLKELAGINALKDDEGLPLLIRMYEAVGFVPEDSVLALYLSGGRVQPGRLDAHQLIIFPFGCNKSQKKAVANALSNQLSIVEGPPGTGKTQTILTIIANLLLQGKTAEVVSNNNSAVGNVREKLCRHGLDFLLASLGSAENKKEFIANQTGHYPDIAAWAVSDEERQILESSVIALGNELDEAFQSQEDLQGRLAELSKLDIEMNHFRETLQEDGLHPGDEPAYAKADSILPYLQAYTMYFATHSHFSILRRICAVYLHKTLAWKEAGLGGERIISILQWRYYSARKRELEAEIDALRSRLGSFSMDEKLRKLTEDSMKLLKGTVCRKYGNAASRPVFVAADFRRNPDAILAEYPIVTSTAFSSASSLTSAVYDYLIIDESSQCDIAAGALSLLSARNAVIVGDSKQLQNIVTEEDRTASDEIFSRYNLPEPYRYSANSFLASFSRLYPEAPAVLLREHYRCQPRIIGFCNEKFYDNQLVIMTSDSGDRNEIMMYLTPPGHHSREHANLRQAEMIAGEILPGIDCDGSIGIITPYNSNAALIRSVLKRDDILVATIHSFQGREMDTIIFATSDDTVSEFSDSPMLINVAVSRAKKRFILAASSDPQPAKSNIHDLMDYISYSGFSTVKSKINSVFDLLYEESTAARMAFLSTHRRISEYDSENLMYSMLEDIVSGPEYADCGFRVICHYPVRYLFRRSDDFTEEENAYLSRKGTHVDFLIYRMIGRKPVAAIEVDGFHFHKAGTEQYSRDQLKDSIFAKSGLPLMRFATNGSGEEEAVRRFLDDYISR